MSIVVCCVGVDMEQYARLAVNFDWDGNFSPSFECVLDFHSALHCSTTKNRNKTPCEILVKYFLVPAVHCSASYNKPI